MNRVLNSLVVIALCLTVRSYGFGTNYSTDGAAGLCSSLCSGLGLSANKYNVMLVPFTQVSTNTGNCLDYVNTDLDPTMEINGHTDSTKYHDHGVCHGGSKTQQSVTTLSTDDCVANAGAFNAGEKYYDIELMTASQTHPEHRAATIRHVLTDAAGLTKAKMEWIDLAWASSSTCNLGSAPYCILCGCDENQSL